jgi:F0F1-type ATP synthase assembly protein I
MDNNTNMNNTNTALTEEEREEELIKTIKMEPILETTELKEDAVDNEKKKIKATNILLIILALILVGVLAFVLYKFVF